MEDNYEKYLNEILNELIKLEKNNRSVLFRINDKVPDLYIRKMCKYFKNSEKYYVSETRKCKSCKDTWDIIIKIKQ